MILSVKVIPNASQDEVVGWLGENLKIRLAAPPVDGKANEALIRFLAKKLDLTSNLEIVRGQTGKQKQVKVPLTEEDVKNALAA